MCGKALWIRCPQSKVCHCAVELMRHAVDPSVFGLANGEIYVEIAVFILFFSIRSTTASKSLSGHLVMV